MNKKFKIQLTPDGYSIHTFALRCVCSRTEWENAKKQQYDNAKSRRKNEMFSISDQVWCCTRFKKQGVRIYFVRHHKGVNTWYSVKLVMNPRKLIDAESSYLGIMPTDESSFEILSERFSDIMRSAGLPEFLDDWLPVRVDLCANIAFNKEKVAQELVRTARKWPTPPKAQQIQSTKHFIEIAFKNYSLVLYNKVWQMKEEGLIIADEKLPNSVLRVEVQYGRKYINKQALAYDMGESTTDILRGMIIYSRELLLKHVCSCVPEASFQSVDALTNIIQNSRYSEGTKDMMQFLVNQLRRKHTLDAALEETARQFKISAKKDVDLLNKFEKINVSPIPLRKKYFRDWLPSIPALLKQIDEDGNCELTIE